MRAEHFATIVARGIGLGLIIVGASDALYAVPFGGMASSGWTSYSPLGTSTANTSFSIADGLPGMSVLLPCAAQLAIGSAMLLLGKPIGRWLARGLKDDSE